MSRYTQTVLNKPLDSLYMHFHTLYIGNLAVSQVSKHLNQGSVLAVYTIIDALKMNNKIQYN